MNPVSWEKAVKYVKAKDKRLAKAKGASEAPAEPNSPEWQNILPEAD